MTQKAPCPHILVNLPLYARNNLSAEEMLSFQTHLYQCPDCTAKTEAYTEIVSLLQELYTEIPLTQETLDSIHNNVMAKILELKL